VSEIEGGRNSGWRMRCTGWKRRGEIGVLVRAKMIFSPPGGKEVTSDGIDSSSSCLRGQVGSPVRLAVRDLESEAKSIVDRARPRGGDGSSADAYQRADEIQTEATERARQRAWQEGLVDGVRSRGVPVAAD